MPPERTPYFAGGEMELELFWQDAGAFLTFLGGNSPFRTCQELVDSV